MVGDSASAISRPHPMRHGSLPGAFCRLQDSDSWNGGVGGESIPRSSSSAAGEGAALTAASWAFQSALALATQKRRLSARRIEQRVRADATLAND